MKSDFYSSSLSSFSLFLLDLTAANSGGVALGGTSELRYVRSVIVELSFSPPPQKTNGLLLSFFSSSHVIPSLPPLSPLLAGISRPGKNRC